MVITRKAHPLRDFYLSLKSPRITLIALYGDDNAIRIFNKIFRTFFITLKKAGICLYYMRNRCYPRIDLIIIYQSFRFVKSVKSPTPHKHLFKIFETLRHRITFKTCILPNQFRGLCGLTFPILLNPLFFSVLTDYVSRNPF